MAAMMARRSSSHHLILSLLAINQSHVITLIVVEIEYIRAVNRYRIIVINLNYLTSYEGRLESYRLIVQV